MEGRPKSRYFAPIGIGALALGSMLAASRPAKINDMIRGKAIGSRFSNHANQGSHPVPGGGTQERERRRRQIAAGQLKRENGLADG